jgi:acyl transferase domain-containing protein/phosphopantetheinyl transferase (holo-ACP synthase)
MAAESRHREPIALIGMDCVFPGARDLTEFWSNIVRGVDAIGEVPRSRWDPRAYDLAPVRAGCIDGLAEFEPLELGIMPSVVNEADPEQFLVAAVVYRALQDAHSGRKTRHPDAPADAGRPPSPSATESATPHPTVGIVPPEAARRTDVVVGRGGYLGNGIEHLHLRMEVIEQVAQLLRRLGSTTTENTARELRRLLAESIPPVTAESVAGAMPNLGASRIANRLDFMGASYTVDAACASALIAVDTVVRSLRDRRCDLGVAAAVHINQKPSFWLAFHTLGALSSGAEIRPFDARADGLLMGEGVGALVLKRLDGAERDGDRVYAVIRGVGITSDGRATGIMSPRSDGEVLALRRAYREAELDPAAVTLVEGHGTATPIGDRTEIAALRQVFGDRSNATVALGSVKSMIGHAMPAAGMAGLIKTALALHHRVLPPTIKVERPHPDLEGSAFFVNTSTSPWIAPAGLPRRAGVSAFGFGGINAHAVLEQAQRRPQWQSLTPRGFELVFVTARSRDRLVQSLEALRSRLAGPDQARLQDVAYTTGLEASLDDSLRLAVVASDLQDLITRLERAIIRLAEDDNDSWFDGEGLYFGCGDAPGKTVVLFPGIGFPGITGEFLRRLGELCLHFPNAHELLDRADELVVDDEFPYPLRYQMFPPPLLDAETHASIERELGWSQRTPIAFLMAHLCAWSVLDELGFSPDAVVGFSLGELAALVATGALDTTGVDSKLIAELQSALASDYSDEAGSAGLWAMVAASADRVEAVLDGFQGRAALAMDVSPDQSFIAGEADAVRGVLERLRDEGVWGQELPQLPMLRPFLGVHTPRAVRLSRRFSRLLAKVPIGTATCPVYSGATGRPYPTEAKQIRAHVLESVTQPVRIRDTIGGLYEQGYRVFVQLGAGGKLLANIHNTLATAPHVAVAVDSETRGGLEQLLHTLGRLAALGVGFSPNRLHRHRGSECIELATPTAVPRRARTLSLSPPRLDPDDASVAAIRNLLGAPAPGRPEPSREGPRDGTTGATASAERFLGMLQQHEQAENQMLSAVLQLQQELVDSLPVAGQTQPEGAPAPTGEVPSSLDRFPFLGDIVRLEPGHELDARLELDLDQHLFLDHHTFLNLPDDLKPAEERLPTLPLTFSLEIVAEAAQALAPGLQVVAVHDVEASRWITLESTKRLTLEIAAHRVTETEVVVQVRPEHEGRPSVVGSATLGSRWPSPPRPHVPTLDRPSPHSAEEFYTVGPLFHGPRFQVISRLDRVGSGAATAEVRVSDTDSWFASPPAVPPLLDPVLLDGLAQVAGYRAWLDGRLLMPVGVRRLSIFGPLPTPGSSVRATVLFRRADGRLFDIDIDACDADGAVILRFEGLRDWRIFSPPGLLELNHRPREFEVAKPCSVPNDDVRCMRVRRDDFADLDPDWIARLYLRGDEWQKYRHEPRLDWLLGRVAVKDAVRAWYRERCDLSLHPLEVEIGNRPGGEPVVMVPADSTLQLSIAHLDDEAVAVVEDTAGIGVDLVAVEDRGREFVETAFDASERGVLETHRGVGQLAVHRAWAAKEAVAKAHGWGLESMGRVRVTALHDDGSVEVATPSAAGHRVHTWTEDGRVMAIARRAHR